MRKNSISQNRLRAQDSLDHTLAGTSGFRGLRLPITCIAVGIAVLYCSERSIASLFDSGSDTPSAFAVAEAFASTTMQKLWQSASGTSASLPAPTKTATSDAATVSSPQNTGSTNASNNSLTSSDRTVSVPQSSAIQLAAGNSLTTASSSSAGLASAVGHIINATANGTGWKGTVNNGTANTGNWSNAGNWDSNGPATDERNLFFGAAYATAGGTNFIANNDIVGYTGFRITFESVASPVSFTLSGNALTLADFGGVVARVENDSTINQNLNFGGLLFGGGLTYAEIDAVNGDLTFGSTDTIGFGGSVAGIKMFGSGHAVNFNDTVNGTGKYFAFTSTGVGNTVNIGGSFTTDNFYVMNNGTLNLVSSGNLNSTAIRLGGDFGTTGNQDQTKNGTFQLTRTTGGQTFSGIINAVAGATGTLNVNSLNTSNTNTLSGSIFLDSNLNISEVSGGILALTGGTLDLKAQTLFLLGNGGFINIGDVISSSTNSATGQLVIGTNGTASTAPTVTLSNTDTYIGQTFVRGGALQFASGGTINNSTIRLGSTSGAAINAAINLINATGGQTIGSVINPVTTSGSGTLTLNSQNTSGTNTLNNHIGLDRNFTITQAAGGTLNITQAHTDGATAGTGYDIKGFTATFTPASTGTINDSGDIYSSSGTGSVVLNGAGTLTLSGNNTFQGTTIINSSGGILNAAANGALGSTVSITVNGGGTLALSGSGNLNRINNAAPITLGTTALGAGTILRSGTGIVSEGTGAHRAGGTVTGTSGVGLGALTLASNSILDFGTGGVGTFTFASYSPGGFTLNILNYTSSAFPASNISGTDGTDDRLIFNQDQSGNLAFFSFNGQGATEIALDSGFFEVVPIPEPSTWIVGMLVVSALAWNRRRRIGGHFSGG